MKKYKPSDQLLKAAQEITLAKALASNEKIIRDRALKKLRKWLVSKSSKPNGFTSEGLARIWRGLFYNIWMSDTPLVQEEVIGAISNLVHCFKDFSDSLAFILSFFQTLSNAWFGLDSHRYDKYLMFVRRFLRQCFVVVETCDWDQEQVQELASVFAKAFTKAPLGLIMHICEIYLEELAKVSKGHIEKDLLLEFLKPFGEIMSVSSDDRLIKHIAENIYIYLLKQSDLGIKHEIKFAAWRKMGYPRGNLNVLEDPVLGSEDEEEFEGSLDARAGNVDVTLPSLNFSASDIVKYLDELKRKAQTTSRARKRLADIIYKYKTFERGKYPLGLHKVDVIQYGDEDELIDDAAMELMEEEAEIFSEDKPLTKNKLKSASISRKGKWLITPIKKSKLDNEKRPESHSPGLHTSWQVTPVVTPVTLSNGENKHTTVQNKKKKVKAKKIIKVETSLRFKHAIASVDKLANGNNESDWGSSCWESNEQAEKLNGNMETQQKLNSSPNSSSLTRSKEKSVTPNVRKKVEFELSKNSIQDEKEYRRCLKKTPVLKFNKDIPPPLGVLKSSPFSSPINPFSLSNILN